MSDWFAAHKDGLRQVAERLVERRGFGIIGGELYQNVMDTSATECSITIKLLPGRPVAEVSVIDNGAGYSDLTHAWTVYAPSEKKNDPTKAGRFNVGCKMALAFCREARIHTTSGTVEFNDEGRHEFPRRKRESGTELWLIIDCTRERYQQFIEYMHKLIVRPGLNVLLNGERLEVRDPIHKFEVALQTEIGEDLRKSVRQTTVEIYEAEEGETAMLYELGIPVVETGDRWHYNVQQKVPLNVDRDNVTPAYLRTLRTAVFNEMHREINEDDTTEPWVQEASSNKGCTAEATKTFQDKRYGEKRVSFDPNNTDANGAAVTSGYTIIPPRGLTAGQRENAKKYGLLVSSSSAFPTAGKGAYSDDPNAHPVDVVSRENWTAAMAVAWEYTVALGWKLLNIRVNVRFVTVKSFPGKPWSACFGKSGLSKAHLDFNIWKLGKAYFDRGVNVSLDKLIIHEFAHYFCGNHADDDFHRACCRLGAQLAELNFTDPKFRRGFERKFQNTKGTSC